jgi:hypothetical protein
MFTAFLIESGLPSVISSETILGIEYSYTVTIFGGHLDVDLTRIDGGLGSEKGTAVD